MNHNNDDPNARVQWVWERGAPQPNNPYGNGFAPGTANANYANLMDMARRRQARGASALPDLFQNEVQKLSNNENGQ